MIEPANRYLPRIPPNDQDAETSVLSAMLFDREAITAAYELLHGEDFYNPVNKEIFETMVDLFSRNIPVDAVTLGDKLAEKGVVDAVGGREAIIRLASNYYTSVNIRHHSRIVWEKSLLRRLIKASSGITDAGFEARDEASVILEMAEKSIFEISQGNTKRDFVHIEDVLRGSYKILEDLADKQGKYTGIETGFTDFDKITSGLQASDLIIVGARPGMGKTAFILNIAQQVAGNGITAAFFSLEMSKEQLGNRLLAQKAKVDVSTLRTGKFSDEEWNYIIAAMGQLSKTPLYIDDTPAITIGDLRAKCRRLKVEKNLGLVVVDYLQLMRVSDRHNPESRQLEISEISRSLKGIAKELDIPMLVAAQLSRGVDSRSDKRPVLSDLRESGAIEQDADIVTFLYRDAYHNKAALNPNDAEVIIAKHRNGAIGTVELTYLGQYTKFCNKG